MLVERMEWHAKPGRIDELVELAKSAAEWCGTHHRGTYRTNIRWDRLAMDLQFEDWTEQDEFWNRWNSDPDTPEFSSKWNDCVTGDGGSEMWWEVE